MGRKRVDWTEQAKANLRAIDQATAIRILHALARLAITGEGDIKHLRGVDPPELRLRVGDYRVRFHDLGTFIRVLAVKHRREAYRSLPVDLEHSPSCGHMRSRHTSHPRKTPAAEASVRAAQCRASGRRSAKL